jgi:hypothetical protein
MLPKARFLSPAKKLWGNAIALFCIGRAASVQALTEKNLKRRI